MEGSGHMVHGGKQPGCSFSSIYPLVWWKGEYTPGVGQWSPYFLKAIDNRLNALLFKQQKPPKRGNESYCDRRPSPCWCINRGTGVLSYFTNYSNISQHFVNSITIWVTWGTSDGVEDVVLMFTDMTELSLRPITAFCDMPYTRRLMVTKTVGKVRLRTFVKVICNRT
jgi:hypothetical protein